MFLLLSVWLRFCFPMFRCYSDDTAVVLCDGVGVSCTYSVKTCRIKPAMRFPWGVRLVLFANAHEPASLFLISACVSHLLDRVLPGTPASLLQILHVQPKFGQAELLDVEFIIRSARQRWHTLARWWERWRKDRNKRTKHENGPFFFFLKQLL